MSSNKMDPECPDKKAMEFHFEMTDFNNVMQEPQ